MPNIPGFPNAANFMGGGYGSPQLVAPQIPGANQLPQIGSGYPSMRRIPQQFGSGWYDPTGGSQPQNGSFNAGIMRALSSQEPQINNYSFGGDQAPHMINNLSSPLRAPATDPTRSPFGSTSYHMPRAPAIDPVRAINPHTMSGIFR